MNKVVIAIAVICYVGICIAQTSDKEEKTKKKISPKDAKPLQVSQTSTSSLQKQVSSLIKKVASLETNMKKLQQSAPATQAGMIGFRRTSDNKYILSANGARIEIDKAGNITIRANINMTLKANANMTFESAVNTSMKATTLRLAAGTMTLESSAGMRLNSKMIRLNDGGRPVAGQGHPVTGICPPHGGSLANATILIGSPTVLVP
jgi:hypothetical protein